MLYVEHNHKFIYCEVPKVGCTSWKRILLLLTMNISRDFSELPQESVHTARMYTKLSSYSPNKQRQLLNNYTKVMFSRQPFERLVSAYRDKFHRNRTDDYYIKSIAGFIKSKFRKSNESEGPLTFIEFVRFILQEPPKHSDIHWRPMSLLCDPCNIRYDIIGKFENLKQDSNHVLMDIGAPKDFYYPHIREHATDTGEEASKSYFRNLSSDHLQGLVSRYYLDFKLFGYPVF
ncbi:carbohydrate sulfotransferase 9-like [Pleurodeles waltl]